MNNTIKELWHGNIMPQSDRRNSTPEMKELLGYISRHHEDLLKTMTEEQKEIFEKFEDCWSEYSSLNDADLFEYAFKLGMNLAIEALSNN
jgi:hypothetical protein